MEMSFRNAIVTQQMTLCLIPKVFNFIKAVSGIYRNGANMGSAWNINDIYASALRIEKPSVAVWRKFVISGDCSANWSSDFDGFERSEVT
jgi:hypothetical protein